MSVSRLRSAAVLLAASVSLGGCATYGQMGGVGVSVGYGNPYASSRYGYSPYGSRYGYSPYGYSPYGSGYGSSPYWGWYDGFYYPGTGFYVYDRYRRAYRMSDRHRHYWMHRQRTVRSPDRRTSEMRQNWEDFSRDGTADTRQTRVEPRDNRTAVRTSVTTRPQVRAESRSDDRQQARREQRTSQRRASQESRGERRDENDE